MKKLNGDHCMVERRGRKFKQRSKMETIVYGGAQGGESLIEEVEREIIVWWSAGGRSLNEVEWRPLYGGAPGGDV